MPERPCTCTTAGRASRVSRSKASCRAAKWASRPTRWAEPARDAAAAAGGGAGIPSTRRTSAVVGRAAGSRDIRPTHRAFRSAGTEGASSILPEEEDELPLQAEERRQNERPRAENKKCEPEVPHAPPSLPPRTINALR